MLPRQVNKNVKLKLNMSDPYPQKKCSHAPKVQGFFRVLLLLNKQLKAYVMEILHVLLREIRLIQYTTLDCQSPSLML